MPFQTGDWRAALCDRNLWLVLRRTIDGSLRHNVTSGGGRCQGERAPHRLAAPQGKVDEGRGKGSTFLLPTSCVLRPRPAPPAPPPPGAARCVRALRAAATAGAPAAPPPAFAAPPSSLWPAPR